MRLDEDQAEVAFEPLNTLFGSEQRLRILEYVAKSDGIQNKDIAEKVGCSKSAVSTFTGQLQDYGFVERDFNNEFHLTATGECIASRVLELAYQSIVFRGKLEPFFSQITTTANTGLEKIVENLITANIFDVSDRTPTDVQKEYERLIDSHNYVRELATTRIAPRESYPKRLNDGLNGEFVLKRNLADKLQEDSSGFLQSLIEAEGTNYVKEADLDFDFTVCIFKEREDSDTGTVALIQKESFVVVTTRDRDVLEWAENCFERYADNANTIEIT